MAATFVCGAFFGFGRGSPGYASELIARLCDSENGRNDRIVRLTTSIIWRRIIRESSSYLGAINWL
ncbi:MAG TPA: hypothetical protein VNQ55_04320 [Parapedobacter sp.]|nr:hypothetical protein [Parapedobacter sp.]